METERKPILDIKIEMNGPAVELQAENGAVTMIPFQGIVKGEIFQGIVEPCGVDTQVVNAAAGSICSKPGRNVTKNMRFRPG